MNPSWDPNAAIYRDSEGRAVPTPAWDSLLSNDNGWDTPTATVATAAPVPTPAYPPAPESPEGSGEGWMYVDPDAYSDPYAPTPVYTSGVQAAPGVTPPTLPPPPSDPGLAGAPGDEWSLVAPGAAGHNGMVPPPSPHPVAPAPPPTLTGPGPDASVDPDGATPERGQLKIKERRTWRTWQLVLVALFAAVLGMWFNGNSGSASGTGSTGTGNGYKLPPPSGSSPATTVAGAASGTSGAAAPTTTAASGATTTTSAGATAGGSTSTSAPAAAVGPATVLIPQTTQSGNWTSPAFTIAGGTWNIGWAFQCAPAPSGGPSFQIFAVTNGASATGTPAVTSTAASGQAVTPLTSTGSQQVIVQTTAACRWAVKVTGSGS